MLQKCTNAFAGGAAGGGRPGDDTTIFVKGFDRSQGEDDIRAALETHFADAGTVVSVRLPSDRETGELKGIGFIQFETAAGKVCYVKAAGFLLPDSSTGQDSFTADCNLLHKGGTVVFVRLPSDRETGELKGIGFIQFETAAGKVCYVKAAGLLLPDSFTGRDSFTAVCNLLHNGGTVVSVRLPSDRETGELKGISFIQCETAAGKVRLASSCLASCTCCGA